MNRNPSSLILFVAILCVAQTMSVGRAQTTRSSANQELSSTFGSSQQPEQTETPDTPIDAAAEEKIQQFRSMSKQLTENQTRIDFLLRTMPIGFADIKKARMAEIEKLKTTNETLQQKIYDGAFEVFAVDPTPDPASLMIVLQALKSKLDAPEEGDVFDPAGGLEICNLMLKKDMVNASVLFNTFRAQFALERFNEAEETLDELAKFNKNTADAIRVPLKETQDNWQRELMIRRLESNTDDLPRVKFITSEGDIVVELFENHAPNTVANFINLIETKRFYDNKDFHLVKPGQYAQTGSPNNDGIGGAGYKIECECFREQIRHHFRGSLSMITSGKDQGSSQFIITHQPNPIWDGRYTVFGRVVEGMDIVFKLNSVDTTRGVHSIEPSKLIRADVVRSRSHDYVPNKIHGSTTPVSPTGIGSIGLGSNREPGGSNKKQGLLKEPGTFDLLLDDPKRDK